MGNLLAGLARPLYNSKVMLDALHSRATCFGPHHPNLERR